MPRLGLLHSLPIHPAIVHFPIALLVLAGAWYAYSIYIRNREANQTAFAIHLIGVTTLAIAIFTGKIASGEVDTLQEKAREVLQTHEIMAYVQIWLFAMTALWRYLRGKQILSWRKIDLYLFGVIYLLALTALFYGAWLGGVMTYVYGVGVSGLP